MAKTSKTLISKKSSSAHYQFEENFFHYSQNLYPSMSNAHFHETYEIYYLIEGKRRYVIEDKMYDLYPGDMILIPEMVTHKVWNVPDSETNNYHARFLLTPRKEDIPEIFLPCFDTHYYHLTEKEQSVIVNCFEDLQRNQKKDQYTPYYNQANLIKILHTLAKSKVSNNTDSYFTPKELRMQEAATYIKENCDQQLTLKELADKYGFTKEYFSTIFKETTGFGVSEYLNQMRIAKAMNLLTTTSLSIMDISNQCGFNDSNYFSAVFKKITHIPPQKFRKIYTHRALR